MATAATAYGERRFGAAYTVRIVLALVLTGVLVGLWSGQTNPHASSHPGLFWLSIGLIAVFATLWIVLGKTVLIINDAGVRRESFLGQQELTWSQIAETRYCVTPVNLYAHFGLIGALVAMSSKSGRAQLTLQLISGEGKKLKVTSAFQKADEAIGIILSRILPPMVHDTKARVQRGETVAFGAIGLSATAVTWKKNSIPLSQITNAELVRSNLQIKQSGKWLAAVNVRSDKLPNVLVFLEVLETLAPQVKSTGVDPLARVRL